MLEGLLLTGIETGVCIDRGGIAMADEKDKFGETMRLVERAKEDIYFAERDRELINKLKAQLQEVEKTGLSVR